MGRWVRSYRILNPSAHGKSTNGLVWQCNYYDRIIRDDKELDRIRLYIIENPRLWAEDPENLL
ncbi:MAG: hypothetical protein A2136_08355 [Chloroflexi bacterium RBG_16_54_11]|nr:MAG: hypothetical protein A2136_08355 [Chloroflexi bacterium RBG_16_54_11]